MYIAALHCSYNMYSWLSAIAKHVHLVYNRTSIATWTSIYNKSYVAIYVAIYIMILHAQASYN